MDIKARNHLILKVRCEVDKLMVQMLNVLLINEERPTVHLPSYFYRDSDGRKIECMLYVLHSVCVGTYLFRMSAGDNSQGKALCPKYHPTCSVPPYE